MGSAYLGSDFRSLISIHSITVLVLILVFIVVTVRVCLQSQEKAVGQAVNACYNSLITFVLIIITINHGFNASLIFILIFFNASNCTMFIIQQQWQASSSSSASGL